jgi:dTDP-4-amino-4,6-dideoxygalactose transaminase
MKIPFLSFSNMHMQIREQVLQSITECYDSNWYILGESVKNFEKKYAEYCSTKYSIGVSNGLDALTLCLKSVGVSAGDEIIVPSNTYIATVLAATNLGAKVVFAEPDPLTLNITANSISSSLSSRTKVIIPVHLYGQSCEMEDIINLAHKNNIFIVEDNAQSHGATYKGKPTGSFGHVNATSFYPGKNLGAIGDAGAVTTDNPEFARKVRIYRNYGSEEKYINLEQGYNMRLDEIQASILSIKLDYLDDWNKERLRIATIYHDALKGIGDIDFQVMAKDSTHVYHLFIILTSHRDSLQKCLFENGISTLIHYPIPPHLQVAYRNEGYKVGDFPIAEKIANTIISLPLYIGMSENEQQYVIDTIKNFYSNI